MSAPVKLVPRKPVLGPGRVAVAGQDRLLWEAKPPAGATLEQVTEPEYWINFAHLFRPGSRIEVISEDFTIDAEFRVVSVRGKNIYLKCLRNGYVDIASLPAAKPIPVTDDDDGFRAKWGGPAHKWRVIGPDGQVVSHGHETETSAIERMHEAIAERRAGGLAQR